MSMTRAGFREAIRADLYRHKGKQGTSAMLKALMRNRSFQITYWFRVAKYYSAKNPLIGFLARRMYRRVCRRYNVDLPLKTQLGKGLIIYHCYGMVVHGKSVIGDNCMLAHQVTLAFEKGAAPVIGDRVRIAPGAKVVGGVEVGSGSVVGANAVVVKHIPANSVAVGVPARALDRPFVDEEERYYWPPQQPQQAPPSPTKELATS